MGGGRGSDGGDVESGATDWGSRTVVQLRAELKKLGLSTAGRKADLIACLQEHFVALAAAGATKEGDEAENSAAESNADVVAEIGDDNAVGDGKNPEADGAGCEDDSAVPHDSHDSEKQEIAEEVVPTEANAGDEAPEAKEGATPSVELGDPEEETPPRKRPAESDDEDDDDTKRPRKESMSEVTNVRIDNFVRPFTLNQARELIEDAAGDGTALADNDFWMNRIKTHAYATLPSHSTALRVIEALKGLHWPEHSQQRLTAELVSISAMEAAAESERDAVRAALERSRQQSQGQRGRGSTTAASSSKRVDIGLPAAPTGAELDDLFKKTSAFPILYWLPLSEAEVSAKRNRPPPRAREFHQAAPPDRRRVGDHRGVCFTFQNTGSCKWGRNCRYSHDVPHRRDRSRSRHR
jgi:hypothetical protein